MMKKLLITLSLIALSVLFGLYAQQLIHQTIESRVPGMRYLVSLGDSVAAGAGLNGNRQSFDCNLSDAAYPIQISKTLGEQVEQLACSGATVVPSDKNATNTLLEQFMAAKPFVRDSDVVVTGGANDIGWLQLLTSCASTNCATSQNHAAVQVKLATMQGNLATLLGQITQQHPHRLVVNTYYDLLADGDTCVQKLGVTTEEVSFIRSEEADLNAAITAAAKQAGAVVVQIDFNGHTLCSQKSWLQGIDAPAPLHPTVDGQKQIATQDINALRR